jgi:hypothetical protein
MTCAGDKMHVYRYRAAKHTNANLARPAGSRISIYDHLAYMVHTVFAAGGTAA